MLITTMSPFVLQTIIVFGAMALVAAGSTYFTARGTSAGDVPRFLYRARRRGARGSSTEEYPPRIPLGGKRL